MTHFTPAQPGDTPGQVEPDDSRPKPIDAVGLTDDEHEVVQELGRIWRLIVTRIVGDGETRETDLREIAAHVHGLQNAVMAQVAARAYPMLYRRLGEKISND